MKTTTESKPAGAARLAQIALATSMLVLGAAPMTVSAQTTSTQENQPANTANGGQPYGVQNAQNGVDPPMPMQHTQNGDLQSGQKTSAQANEILPGGRSPVEPLLVIWILPVAGIISVILAVWLDGQERRGGGGRVSAQMVRASGKR